MNKKRLIRSTFLAIILWTALSCSPRIESADSVDSAKGKPFNHNFEASNNPDTFGAENLPDGLDLPDEGQPLILGTPTKEGTFQTTLSATNRFGTGTKKIQINVLGPRPPVDSARELMITHPSLLTDPRATSPDGDWHIATTIRRLTGSADERVNSRFILNWLREWEDGSLINSDPADDVRAVTSTIINPWIQASGGDPDSLDWSQAPFRLNAIVNRIDLTKFRNDDVTGDVEKLGEARLVYADKRGGRFHAIFEFGIPGPATRANVVQWARQWRDLSDSTGFGENYKSALAAITRQFVTEETMAADRGQLRTNELFIGSPWQLREFKLRNGAFQQEVVAMNPQQRFNEVGNTTLIKYLTENQDDILVGKHTVPRRFNGQAFAGGVSNTTSPSFKWKNPNAGQISEAVRFHFSRNTCNGCHGGDGPGVSFVHIRNVQNADQSRVLSPFLRGPQPIPGGGTHDEMNGRRIILTALDADQSEVRLQPAFRTASLRRAKLPNKAALHEYCRKELQIRRNRTH